MILSLIIEVGRFGAPSDVLHGPPGTPSRLRSGFRGPKRFLFDPKSEFQRPQSTSGRRPATSSLCLPGRRGRGLFFRSSAAMTVQMTKKIGRRAVEEGNGHGRDYKHHSKLQLLGGRVAVLSASASVLFRRLRSSGALFTGGRACRRASRHGRKRSLRLTMTYY